MSYINQYTLLGMLSKNYTVDIENKLVYKNKAKDKVIVFDENFNGSNYSEVNYSYIDNKPSVKNFYKLTEVISYLPSDYFTNLNKYSREIHQTRNKWNKQITIKKELSSIDEVLELLDRWVEYSGKKYRFTRHDGYDRNFFRNYYEKYKDILDCNFFYLGDKLVGYSIMSPKVDDTYYYIIRKVDISVGRNIGEYVDFKTFELLNDNNFKINWGSSSGGVLNYKCTKFPLFSKTTKYFWKVKNEKNI